MVGVFDVAEYVLSEVGYVSTMKLQKLVFQLFSYLLFCHFHTSLYK